MSELEDVIKRALREDAEAFAEDWPAAQSTPTSRLVELFLRRSRWVAGFAWMKMIGTLAIAIAAAIAFVLVESTKAQLACLGLFVVGFSGFGMWWIWYWQVVNRNAQLREIKRLELQIAELRASGAPQA